MARAIDADELLGITRLLDTDAVRKSKTASWLLDQVLHDIQAMPTIALPNEPLTLKQLREMNGQPVWVEEINHWALIDIETGGRWSGIPFAVGAENGASFCYNIKARNLHCYRCQPKKREEMQNAAD